MSETHAALVAELERTVDFLCGAADYDGAWFGDNHPELGSRGGRFWWRSVVLRPLHEKLATALREHDTPSPSASDTPPAPQHSPGSSEEQAREALDWLERAASAFDRDLSFADRRELAEILRNRVTALRTGVSAQPERTEPRSELEQARAWFQDYADHHAPRIVAEPWDSECCGGLPDCPHLNSDKCTARARPVCGLCGDPMPEGEEMFQYHGHSGPCPTRASQPERVQQESEQPWAGHAYVPPREGHGSWGCEVCNYSEDMHTDTPERE